MCCYSRCFRLHRGLRRDQRFCDEGIEQVAAVVLGTGEARLHLVAQRYQFIDLGDDAVLLGKGWNRDREPLQLPALIPFAVSPVPVASSID